MMMSPAEIWPLDTTELGQHVQVYDTLDSTNTLALSLAHDPAQHGLALLARAQTSGRGQYGRVWQAPPGSSVLMSLLLFPPLELRRPPVLTAWAAVSVCETILKLANLQAKIKWPNDVLIQGKKVCGILIEQRTTRHADFPLATVVGIGLNVTQSATMFEQAGLPDAASVGMLSGLSLCFEDVATALIRELDAQWMSLVDGDLHTLEAQWKWRLGLLGEQVMIEGVQQNLAGRLVDATFSSIEIDAGEIQRLAPEAIKHIHSA